MCELAKETQGRAKVTGDLAQPVKKGKKKRKKKKKVNWVFFFFFTAPRNIS